MSLRPRSHQKLLIATRDQPGYKLECSYQSPPRLVDGPNHSEEDSYEPRKILTHLPQLERFSEQRTTSKSRYFRGSAGRFSFKKARPWKGFKPMTKAVAVKLFAHRILRLIFHRTPDKMVGGQCSNQEKRAREADKEKRSQNGPNIVD